MYEQARHECAVRYLCHLRHKKGLTWFRIYISEKNFSQCELIRMTQRLVFNHDKESDLWSVEVTDGKMPSSLLKSRKSQETSALHKLQELLKSSFLQMAKASGE